MQERLDFVLCAGKKDQYHSILWPSMISMTKSRNCITAEYSGVSCHWILSFTFSKMGAAAS